MTTFVFSEVPEAIFVSAHAASNYKKKIYKAQ
jgi:hypothetical protein